MEEGEKATEGRRLTAEAAGCSMEPEDDGAERIDDEVSGCGRRCRRRGRRSTRGLRRGEQGEGGRIRDEASRVRPSPARRRLGATRTRRTRRVRLWPELLHGGGTRTTIGGGSGDVGGDDRGRQAVGRTAWWRERKETGMGGAGEVLSWVMTEARRDGDR